MINLSIIIVSFNTEKLTLNCIKSVELEGSKINKEIIVIDNNSTDGSARSLALLVKRNGEIKFIGNDKNLGFAKAVNQGIKQAKGKYILLLNSDSYVLKGVFNKPLNFIRQEPSAGVIGARLINTNGKVQPSVTHLPTISGAIGEYWLGKKSSYEMYAPESSKPIEVEAVFGAAFLITPKALKKVGLLDERYFMYFEDLDYCRRVRKSNLGVYYLPTAKIIHHHGESGKSLARAEDQWRRLIPSSKIYHGIIKHYLINFIIRSGSLTRGD